MCPHLLRDSTIDPTPQSTPSTLTSTQQTQIVTFLRAQLIDDSVGEQ
jgi:hypothetical protein